MIIQKQK